MNWLCHKRRWLVIALMMLAIVIGLFIWRTPPDRGVAIRFKEFRELRGSRCAVLEVENNTGHPVRYLCPYRARAASFHHVDGVKMISADRSTPPTCPCGLPEHRLESGDVVDYPVSLPLTNGMRMAVPFRAGLYLNKLPRDVVNNAPAILRNYLPNSWYDSASGVALSEVINP